MLGGDPESLWRPEPEARGRLQESSLRLPPGGKRQDLEIEEVLFHPKYNINAKKEQGILEFYDYDVALVKLKNKVTFSQTLR